MLSRPWRSSQSSTDSSNAVVLNAISLRVLSLPTVSSQATSHRLVCLCRGTLCLAALVAMLSGCRGSYPMARSVQVTHDPSLELPEYDAPPQRLATAKPRVGSEVPPQISSGSKSQMAKASNDVETEGRVAAVSHIDDSSAAVRSVSTATTKTMQYAADANLSTENRSMPTGRTLVREGNTQVESVHRTISSNPNKDSAQLDPQQLPAGTSEMFEAFKNSPPEVQQLALRQLIAATSRSGSNANPGTNANSGINANLGTSSQSVGDVLQASFNETVANETASTSKQSGSLNSAVHVAHATDDKTDENLSDSASASLSHYIEDASVDHLATKTASHVSDEEVHVESLNKVAKDVPSTGAHSSLSHKSEPKSQETVSGAIASTLSSPPSLAASPVAASVSPSVPVPVNAEAAKSVSSGDVLDVASLSESQLYDELLGRLSKSTPDESDANRSRRLVMLRHLMVLSGHIDDAVSRVDGMAENEQEYLRHQLLGLWTIIDPDGHPVPGRRFSAALPQLREATTQLAAATDSLDVRSLAFCTEIESYGQIKKFANKRFKPGQQVILYCEIENFVASKVANGFETNLQGSYDVFNEAGAKVASQLLPADRQVSNNYLRDYFIAYQMYLPKDLDGGNYRLQLTIEDLNGKKYGQSVIPFELAR